jgi:hypothetical protein
VKIRLGYIYDIKIKKEFAVKKGIKIKIMNCYWQEKINL